MDLNKKGLLLKMDLHGEKGPVIIYDRMWSGVQKIFADGMASLDNLTPP